MSVSTASEASRPRDVTGVELSVVMPCLNEAETLATCIDKAIATFQEHGIAGEVIIADNGSTDGSQRIAVEHGARVENVPFRGYGNALMGGVAASRARYVIMGDSDDSYDFRQAPKFLAKLREGYDLVLGNRFQGGIEPGAMPPLHRYFGNPLLTALGRFFFRTPTGDIYCGLRGFDREAIQRLDLRSTGMEYACEMIIKATLRGLKIAEVPTTLSPDGRNRPPHLRSWRDGWRTLRFMLLYSPRWLFLYPGIFLMLVGTLFGLRLVLAPLVIRGVTLDVHTLVYAALLVPLGFQMASFAVFAKLFAITEGLLPPDPRLDRLFQVITLETGLVAGAALLALGLGGSVLGLFVWGRSGFGVLDYASTLRIVIPSATALLLGAQVVFSSFFLSILGLGRR